MGAICPDCLSEMLTVTTCTIETFVFYNGEVLPRIRWGHEGVLDAMPTWRCHDCGVMPGGFHHYCCCVEMCPGCMSQRACCCCHCGLKEVLNACCERLRYPELWEGLEHLDPDDD